MERYAIEELIKWKDSKKRKPLILRGARQVGKTWLLQELGRKYFSNTAYISFDNNERMDRLFEGDYNINTLIAGLQIEGKENINPGSTLIIFDEIQENNKALNSLKYFYENAPEYALVAAGSLLGVAMHQGEAFPVGKVDYCNLYPMSFCEFLEAIDKKNLVDLIKNMDWNLILAFKSDLIRYLKQYFFVGGMPEVVADFIDTNDFSAVRKRQNTLNQDYENDFSKHALARLVPKIREVWQGLPRQLARKNKKFSVGLIKKGGRMADYSDAISWLNSAGLLYQVKQISKPNLPLLAYETFAFKPFIHDIGLLGAMSNLSEITLLEENSIFTEFKGSLSEQYVCQELTAMGIKPYYWSSERTAEIDFLINIANDIFPLEVKASNNLQGKSLKVYKNAYAPKKSFRLSMRDYKDEGWLVNIPLYGFASLGWQG